MLGNFTRTTVVVEAGRSRGLHYGCQVCVIHRGNVVLDTAIGEARPGEPLTTQHRMMWLSAGKPLTVVLLARLWEEGLVDIHAPVARYLPEFGVRGKEAITVKHLLVHTAGLRDVDHGWPEVTWDETIRRICAAGLDHGALPGVTPAYHPMSTWFVLGEVVRRVSRRSFEEFLTTELLTPCGMTQVSLTANEESPTYSPLYERQQGELVELPWNAPPRRDRPSPGSSLRAPIRELAVFYEMLRQQGRHGLARIIRPPTVEALTARHRIGEHDLTLQHAVDFGLGFLINGAKYGVDTVPYGYGRYASPETFGHGGAQCTQGYCDPGHELAVAYAFNGRPGEGQHQRRVRAINDAIYEDLGLAAP